MIDRHGHSVALGVAVEKVFPVKVEQAIATQSEMEETPLAVTSGRECAHTRTTHQQAYGACRSQVLGEELNHREALLID